MLDFVGGINPTSQGPSIADDVPPQCLSAMRTTVTNLLGTLPPQFFRVTISTRGDNLAQLMFSVLMTGYMFSNAWHRLELAQSLGVLGGGGAAARAAEPQQLVGSLSGSVDDAYAPASKLAAGSQKLRVQGEVLRWHVDDGVQNIPALDYIEQLEAELEALRAQLEAQARGGAGPSAAAAHAAAAAAAPPLGSYDLLEHLKGLTGEQVVELTDCATADCLEAMNALVERLMGDGLGEGEGEPGGAGPAAWGEGRSECTAVELAHLLCWLMAVGHHLRTLEVRMGLRATLDSPGALDGDDGPGGGGGGGGGSGTSWVPRLPPAR
jgi:hypothetical protein